MSIQIYCMGKQDRSDRVRWLLEELGVEYQDHFLNRKKGELSTPAYRKLNPMGRVPTIVDGEITLFESVGISLYLADRYQSKAQLAPGLNSVERGHYLQWMVWSVASLEAVVAKMFTFDGKSDSEVNEIKKYVSQQCEILKLALLPVLEKQDYVLKSGFSAADIMLAAVIPGAWDYLVKDHPSMERYMQRLMNRPAAKKAQVFDVPDMTNA